MADFGDALVPPDLPSALPKRTHATYATSSTSSPSPGDYETSEYLIGSVAVGVILLQSNGSIDQQTESWTSSRESQVVSKISDGLSWLAKQNPDAHVSFVYDVHYRVPTSYEPINRPHTDDHLWISEAMSYLGNPGTNQFYQVRKYITALRTTLHTNWAFAIFVVDSLNDKDGMFADVLSSWFAYSYVGGPFLVMTYDNDRWGINNMDNIAVHETLHIFYATDEYQHAGITPLSEYSGYLNVSGVIGTFCIMDSDASTSPIWKICPATRGQIGWRDTDGDGVQDIVDTFPKTVLNLYQPNPTNNPILTYTGTVVEIPYPNRNPRGTGRNVTVNTIVDVQFRIDSGFWINTNATDGAFDEALETISFTTQSLLEDTHTVEARGINSVGNLEASYSKDTITIDPIPPTTSHDYDGLWHTKDFRVNLAANDDLSGVGNIFYKINDGSIKTVSTDGQPLVSTESANNTLEYWSVDNAGNQETHHVLTGIKLDKTAPTSVDNYDGLWHNADFTIDITTTDNSSGVSETYYKINGGQTKAMSTDGQPLISSEGTNNTLEYWSVDNVGNEGLPHKTLIGIKLDKTAPITSDDYNGTWQNADFTITLTANDNVGGVAATYYRVNAGSIETTNGTVQPRITFEGANNTLEYWSVDEAGNEETHHIVTGIKLDKTMPVGSIIINNGDVYTNSTSATLSLNANDSVSGVAEMRFSNDNVSWVSWEMYNASQAWLLTLGDGTKMVYCQFMDNAGLASSVCTDSIVLDTTGPIVETPARTPQGDVKPDQSVTVSVNASDLPSGVRSVWLSYNTSSDLWSDFPMALNTTTGLYEYTIPGQKADTLEKYKITANDLAGNSVTNDNAGQYYQYKTVSEFPWLVVFLSVGAATVITIATLLAVIILRRKRARALLLKLGILRKD